MFNGVDLNLRHSAFIADRSFWANLGNLDALASKAFDLFLMHRPRFRVLVVFYF